MTKPLNQMPDAGDRSPQARQQRQKAFLAQLKSNGGIVTHATETLSLRTKTVYDWRSSDLTFAALMDQAAEIGRKNRRLAEIEGGDTFNPALIRVDKPVPSEFRARYVGRPIPAHQQPVFDAWEDKTNQMVIWLAPTGAGKDTTAGDFVVAESLDRRTRVAWVMENQTFSRRRVQRMERYFWDMTAYTRPEGPDTHDPQAMLMEDYGTFRWKKGLKYPDGTPVPQTKWTQDEIYFVGRENEADPNIWATSIEGAMYGSRIDVAVLSDIFTQRNQATPGVRDTQMDWLFGTFMSRLDDAGRALFLGTRVGPWDNWGRLIERVTADIPIMATSETTHTSVTKYSNGICVIITKAIGVDDEGRERVYWPERFELESYFQKPKTKTRRYISSLTTEEMDRYAKQGWVRYRGLYEIRDRDPQLFETMQQQNPGAAGDGEFPLALLDRCDDFDHTYGQYRAGSTLVVGIDPARTGGAAWVLWSWDGETARVVDYFFGTNLGVNGMRERLLVDPILTWGPRYAVYEDNREASALVHPQVLEAVKSARTELRGRNTNMMNRGIGELRVAAMSLDMASGVIRWPAQTAEDRKRSDQIKEHFLAWDQKQEIRNHKGSVRSHIADDIAMAAWIGWVKVKELAGRRANVMPTRGVARSVAKTWGYRQATPAAVARAAVETDLWAAYRGWGGDD